MRRAVGRISWLRRLAIAAIGLSVLAALVVGVRGYRNYAARQRWSSEFQRLDARVVIAGYGGTADSPVQIPILNEILTQRSQAELFVYNPKTVDEVLNKAQQYPELKRIWVNMNVFDRSIGDQIEERMPGMDVVFYTPGPGMR